VNLKNPPGAERAPASRSFDCSAPFRSTASVSTLPFTPPSNRLQIF
jgi:hypothetical protein